MSDHNNRHQRTRHTPAQHQRSIWIIVRQREKTAIKFALGYDGDGNDHNDRTVCARTVEFYESKHLRTQRRHTHTTEKKKQQLLAAEQFVSDGFFRGDFPWFNFIRPFLAAIGRATVCVCVCYPNFRARSIHVLFTSIRAAISFA